jgi:hypothetical protein
VRYSNAQFHGKINQIALRELAGNLNFNLLLLKKYLKWFHTIQDWFTFIFRFHKATLLEHYYTICYWISWIIGYLEVEYWKLADTSYVKILPSCTGCLVS